MKLHVVFTLAGTEYALPVDSILQMESFAGATLVPGAPSYVAGIVTVRGLVVPVIDLRLRFGLPPSELTLDTRIIVTECAGRVVALRVDSAREVIRLDEAQHQPAPSVIAERAQGFVRAVHPVGPRLLLIADLPRILGEITHDPIPAPLLEPQARPRLPG